MIPILYSHKEKEFTSLGLGALTGIIDIHVYEERNGLFYLEMNYHRDAQNSKNLINGNIIMVDSSPDLQNQKFVINRVTSEAKGTIKVYAEHISQNLTKNLTLKPKVTMTGDAKTALTIWNDNILSDNKFIVYSDITLEKKIDWSITNIKNARQALGGTEGSILDLYGGEYKFDNNFISLFKNRGKDRNVLLSYGKNIVDLIKDEDSEDIVTSIQPYSINIDSESGESELLTLPENIIHGKYVGFYDAPKVAIMAFNDEDIQSVEDLRDRAFEYLYSNNIGQPKFQIDVEYQDLIDSLDYGEDANHELTALCDTIYIDFEKMGVDLVKAKIVKTDYNPIKDKFHSLTIGTINSRFRNNVPTLKTMENFNKSIEDRTSEIIAYLGADGSATIFNGEETPTARRINDIWYKPNGSTDWQMFIWDGYRWVMTQDTSIPSEAKLIAEEAQKKVEEAEERAKVRQEEIDEKQKELSDSLLAFEEELQNVEGSISTRITSVEGNYSQLTQVVNGIQSEVNNEIDGIKSTQTQLSDLMSTKVSSSDVSTIINQSYDSIYLGVQEKVKSEIDKNQMTGNEIKTAINLSTNGVDISGKFISITGETSISNGVIKTAHIGDAQITDAKIGNLTFNWAKGKTLNAEEVNLINLNANSMTTGTLTGMQGSWNLNSGLFRNGSTSGFETRLQYGTMTQYEGGIERLRMNPQGLQFFSKVGTGQHIGMMMSAEYKATGKHGLTIGHSYPDNAPAFINIGYLNTEVFNSTGNRTYDPYIIFDKWNSISDIGTAGYPIKVMERAEFRSQTLFDTSIDVNDYIKTGAWRWSAVTGLADAIGGAGFKIVDGLGYGFGFGANFTIWKVLAHSWTEKII